MMMVLRVPVVRPTTLRTQCSSFPARPQAASQETFRSAKVTRTQEKRPSEM